MCNQAAPCNLYLDAAMLIHFPFNIGWNGEHEAARAILDISNSRLRCSSSHSTREDGEDKYVNCMSTINFLSLCERLACSLAMMQYLTNEV